MGIFRKKENLVFTPSTWRKLRIEMDRFIDMEAQRLFSEGYNVVDAFEIATDTAKVEFSKATQAYLNKMGR